MSAISAAAPMRSSVRTPAQSERRWDLAFIGILLYLIIDYTRLPAIFPVLIDFQVGKIAVALATLGMIFSRRAEPIRPVRSGKIEILLLAYLAIALLSTLFAADQAAAWKTFADMARCVTISLLIGRVVSSRWRMQVLLLFFVLLNLKLAQFQIRSYMEGVQLVVSDAMLANGI